MFARYPRRPGRGCRSTQASIGGIGERQDLPRHLGRLVQFGEMSGAVDDFHRRGARDPLGEDLRHNRAA